MVLPKVILVPVDLSERSTSAVRHAGELAGVLGARLVLTVNVNLPERAELELVAREEDISVDDAARRALEEIAARHAAGVSSDVDVRYRDFPADGILDAAAETGAEMVVIASHGRSGPSRWLLGSVAEKIVRAAPVPVLVVPVRDQ